MNTLIFIKSCVKYQYEYSPVENSVPRQFKGGVFAVSNNHKFMKTLNLKADDLETGIRS